MYRNKLIILGLLLISISPASAWWNTDWENRREIQINNTLGSELTYYQVYINLSDNPINSTSLRIVNESAGATVPHWQETISSGNCTELWFNATAIPPGLWLNETYYIYYNNNVLITSNIKTTFLFGDDGYNKIVGNSLTTGNWNPVVNGIYTNDKSYSNNISLKVDGTGESYAYAYYNILDFNTWIIESKVYDEKLSTTYDYCRFGIAGISGSVLIGWEQNIGGNYYQYIIDGPKTTTGVLRTVGWHTFKIIYTGTHINIFIDDIEIKSLSTYTINSSKIYLKDQCNNGVWFDNIYIRKYTINEPILTYNAAEERPFIPPIPTNLDHSKGFFWVNHTWNAGVGNVTDSYNILHNNIWYNETINTYYNSGDIGGGGYSEILIYAYNNSGFLSEEYVTQNISAPPHISPPVPINLQYTKGEYWVNHTWDEGLDGFTNSYNISHNESWTNGSSNTYFNSGGVGRNGVSTIIVYAFNGFLSEEYVIQTISTKPGIGYDQKISDSNIQLFFFPVMFFLLIMILVGGFKYVYK